MTEPINADFSRTVVVDTAAMDWQTSPSATVWRKRLDLTGEAESSRVTSVVRYDANSAFHSHPHPDGEEIFVLDGVFSDETGDFPAGTFLLNPEGFDHAPRSAVGCILFVKLRQYPGSNRERVIFDTNTAPWLETDSPGVARQLMYESTDFPEKIFVQRMSPGAQSSIDATRAGIELFVLRGAIEDEDGTRSTGTWIRRSGNSGYAISSRNGCDLYLKVGHLGGLI